jgi:hypothetical protein
MEGGLTVKHPTMKPAAAPLSVELPFKQSKDGKLRLKVWHKRRASV